jgi:hypothetical protein
MKRLLPFTFFILLSACATGPSYVETMMGYQGKTEAELVDALGPPERVYDVNGTRYLSYSRVSQQRYASDPEYGAGVAYGHDDLFMSERFGDNATFETWRCDVFFALRNHRVVKIGYRGNAC